MWPSILSIFTTHVIVVTLKASLYSASRGPLLICGDFNAHHRLWASTNDDQNGQVVKDFLDFNDFVILNDGTGSLLNITIGNISCIDLTICSPAFRPDVNRRVDQSSPCASDHFPVHACFGWSPHRNSIAGPPRWKLKQADWTAFHNESHFNKVYLMMMLTFLTVMLLMPLIPKSSGRPGVKKGVSWWSEDCADAIRPRKRDKTELVCLKIS